MKRRPKGSKAFVTKPEKLAQINKAIRWELVGLLRELAQAGEKSEQECPVLGGTMEIGGSTRRDYLVAELRALADGLDPTQF